MNNDLDLLNELQSVVEKLQKTPSTNEKVNILKAALTSNANLQSLFAIIYNELIPFHVTSDNCKKHSDFLVTHNYNLLILLGRLANRLDTGNYALGLVNYLCSKYPQHVDLIHNIIDKDLKINCGASLINKAIPQTIPVFKVALANPFDEKYLKKGKWFASRKLDGVRCIAIVKSNHVLFYSRKGKQFHTLGKVEDNILNLPSLSTFNKYPIVLDGEIVSLDLNGNESFSGIMREIKRKDHTIEDVCFKIFDCLSYDELYCMSHSPTLSDRFKRIDILLSGYTDDTLQKLDQTLITQLSDLDPLKEQAINSGWEGLILRKDIPYEGKRSNNMLKWKMFHDAEFIVESITTGPISFMAEDGSRVEEEMLSAVNILYKGNVVGVGSGFTLDERRHFYQNPSDIIGKTICVQYFEESEDSDGNLSLRFPTVKVIYEDGRDV